MTRLLRAVAGFVGCLAAIAVPNVASAQSFPERPITLVVPFGAGGGTDIIARAVSEELGRALK
jgi:tripartite-type tricarboxylate transporter receptor subunit TctC